MATDIAARGIHVDDIALVVHVDPPTEHKAYLHRSGRTARAGAKGTVVTVILPDQVRDVASMIRQAGIRPASARVGPGARETACVGRSRGRARVPAPGRDAGAGAVPPRPHPWPAQGRGQRSSVGPRRWLGRTTLALARVERRGRAPQASPLTNPSNR